MRTYPLYDPKVYSIVIFRSKENKEEAIESLKTDDAVLPAFEFELA